MHAYAESNLFEFKYSSATHAHTHIHTYMQHIKKSHTMEVKQNHGTYTVVSKSEAV